ncbi:MAG: carboxypeptidase-like regulatory domain-containing protein, partial [Bacteroidota bacterium]
MYKIYTLIFLFVISSTCFSQTTIKLKGQIIDENTKNPISYACIGIINKQIGTSTNSEGNFIFNVSNKCLNDSIIITALGYYTYKIAIKDFSDKKSQAIQLKPQIFNLSSVTFNSKKLSALEILKKAEKKIKENINTNPYMIKAYYREFHKEDSLFARAAEASTTIYYVYKKFNYKNFPIRIDAIRASEDFRQQKTNLINQMSFNLGYILTLEVFMQKWNKMQCDIDSMCIYNNRLVYVISTKEITKAKYRYLYQTSVNKVTNEEISKVIDSIPSKSVSETQGLYYIDALSYAFIKIDNLWNLKYNDFSKIKIFNNT